MAPRRARNRGAATFLLLGQIRRKLFSERRSTSMLAIVQALTDPQDFARELIVPAIAIRRSSMSHLRE
jgi:hypothetical protein